MIEEAKASNPVTIKGYPNTTKEGGRTPLLCVIHFSIASRPLISGFHRRGSCRDGWWGYIHEAELVLVRFSLSLTYRRRIDR